MGSKFGGVAVEETAGSKYGGIPVVDEAPTAAPSHLRGYHSDPAEDQRAYDKAKEMADLIKPGAMDRFQRAGVLGLSGPINGLYSMLAGDGYEFGTAVDRYYEDFAKQNSGELGDVASVAGSILTPVGPAGKMATGLRGIAEAAGVGAGLSGIESAAQPDASVGGVARDALIGGLLSGGATQLGRMASPSAPIPPREPQSLIRKMLMGGQAGGMAGAAVGSGLGAGPGVGATVGGVLGSSAAVTPELLARLMQSRGGWGPALTQSAPLVGSELQQLLMQGGQ